MATCPCCKDKVETLEHFLQCASNSQRSTSLGNLKSAICNSNFHPVCYLLLHGMCHLLTHGDALPFKPSLDEFPPHFSPYLQDNALESQQTVRWDKAVKGFYSKCWHIIAYMDMCQSGRNDPTKGIDRMRSISISCRSQIHICHTARSERRLTSEGQQFLLKLIIKVNLFCELFPRKQ